MSAPAASSRPHVRFDVDDDSDVGPEGAVGDSQGSRWNHSDLNPASSSGRSPLASTIVALTTRLRSSVDELVTYRIGESAWARSLPLTSFVPVSVRHLMGSRCVGSTESRSGYSSAGEPEQGEEGQGGLRSPLEWSRALEVVRIRPLVLVLLAICLVLLGILGLAPIPEVPINDKVLHFVGMGTATFLLYFVLDVSESVDGINAAYIRHAPLALTILCGFVGGGILSEIVQSMLPYKAFDIKDILANLLGSGIALFAARRLEARATRHSDYERIALDSGEP